MAAVMVLSLAGGGGLGKELLENPIRHPVQQGVERSAPGRGGHLARGVQSRALWPHFPVACVRSVTQKRPTCGCRHFIDTVSIAVRSKTR